MSYVRYIMVKINDYSGADAGRLMTSSFLGLAHQLVTDNDNYMQMASGWRNKEPIHKHGYF